MREFRVMIPQQDNMGLVDPEITSKLFTRITQTFKAVHVSEARDAHGEPVYAVDVATSGDAAETLAYAVMLAEQVKNLMGHESVYFRNVDGTVKLL